MCRQIRVKLANVEFYENIFSGTKVVSLCADKQRDRWTDGQTGRQTDIWTEGHCDFSTSFSRLRTRLGKVYICHRVCSIEYNNLNITLQLPRTF
jgi:hypothetical protein